MVDYSKWDFINDEDEELKTPSSPTRSRGPPTKGTGGPDPDLIRQLTALKNDDPAKLKELESELEVMKAHALQQKAMAGNGGPGGAPGGAPGGGPGGGAGNTIKAGNVQTGISSQADVLKQSMAALDQKKKDMETQMAQLEQLAAAGDGESVMRFFESQGMTPEDLQRMMGGSDADTHQVLDQTAAKNASEGIDEKGSDSALNFAEQIDAVVRGDDLPPPPGGQTSESGPGSSEVSVDSDDEAEADKAPEGVAPPVPKKQIVIPEHMQQLGKEGVVIMVVRLPKLESATDVTLDVAPRMFKLRAEIPGEYAEYALSLELGSTIDPGSSKAKWKKKENSLRIELSPPLR
uniref:PIH1D1/2/3 CS-like domain-containing protein n=1 Tax=Florenciella parvula TaxID=236787 RepID=A0A7S2FBP4_9STRA|mmetsp:Transcript_12866/g.27114  ORF Transcript_12866/g.27114 Transcript_12866/m.27114 type:complete len:348 (+) Transcript_12866:229-1272(+)